MDSGEDVFMALSEQEDEQRLRAAAGERRSLHLRGDESPDGQAFGSLMRLFRQFQDEVQLRRTPLLLTALHARRCSRSVYSCASPASSGIVFSTFKVACRPRSLRVERWLSNHGFSCIRRQRSGGSSTPARRASVFPTSSPSLVQPAPRLIRSGRLSGFLSGEPDVW